MKVLMVDEENFAKQCARDISECLQARGYHTNQISYKFADSVEAAFEEIEGDTFDCLILESCLPVTAADAIVNNNAAEKLKACNQEINDLPKKEPNNPGLAEKIRRLKEEMGNTMLNKSKLYGAKGAQDILLVLIRKNLNRNIQFKGLIIVATTQPQLEIPLRKMVSVCLPSAGFEFFEKPYRITELTQEIIDFFHLTQNAQDVASRIAEIKVPGEI